MAYCVYRLRYRTKWNAPRVYIGYTGFGEWRKVWHEVKANSRNVHRDPDCDLEWSVLEDRVESKPLALALEAFHAARAVTAEPSVARGGPYARLTLTKLMREEAWLVHRMTMAIPPLLICTWRADLQQGAGAGFLFSFNCQTSGVERRSPIAVIT